MLIAHMYKPYLNPSREFSSDVAKVIENANILLIILSGKIYAIGNLLY